MVLPSKAGLRVLNVCHYRVRLRPHVTKRIGGPRYGVLGAGIDAHPRDAISLRRYGSAHHQVQPWVQSTLSPMVIPYGQPGCSARCDPLSGGEYRAYAILHWARWSQRWGLVGLGGLVEVSRIEANPFVGTEATTVTKP